MTNELPVTPEIAFQIDFNFQQVPSALALDISPEAAAALLGITADQFTAYTDFACAECTNTAQALLEKPGMAEAVHLLKQPRLSSVSRVLTVGDSITTYRYGYAEILRALLPLVDPEQPVEFVNYGRSGYTSTHGLEHTYTQYQAHKPDWVFIKYGANDMKHFGGPTAKTLVSTEEYAANMAQIVDAFVQGGARIILITPSPVVEAAANTWPDFAPMQMTWDNADFQTCADALRAIAEQHSIPLVDLVALYTLNPDPVLYVPDGLHPGPLGHQILIEKALDAVRTYA